MSRIPVTGTVEVAPSILAADFSRLAEHIGEVEPQVQMLHMDVMDGHFVPNISFGPGVVGNIRPQSKLIFDTHLMIADPIAYAPEFVKAGVDHITFHLEVDADPSDVIACIRELLVSVGVSIRPSTPVADLAPIIGQVDMVLLMTVEPGFGAQEFLPDSVERCRTLKKMLRPDQRLEVDGGIDALTAPDIVAAGADTLVVGSSIFGNPDPAAAAQAIHQAAVAGTSFRK